MFELYQKCIRRQGVKPLIFDEIESLRKQLKGNSKTITYKDFGASATSSGAEKKTSISTLARRHLKPPRLAQILFRILEKYKYKNKIELGTSLGITSSYLAAANTQESQKLITIEACQDVMEIALQNFSALRLSSKIESLEGTFDEVLPHVLNQMDTLDFLFVDGNHSYEATLRYFELCLPKANNNSVFVFDDIYWSQGMTKAWEEIKNHPQVTVSVDLFFIGLIYFRKEQVKQNFKLRVF